MENPENYWNLPTGFGPAKELWDDPAPDIYGILAADRIEFYVNKTRMIDPFDRTKLKPASYPLTLGPLYQIDGKNFTLTKADPILDIPPNSIAFVSMAERLMIPHYIVARFDLRVDLVYWGLLLGTGPQVDPGFHGVLSCPFHNISSNPIRLTLGDHVATIEFIKTTRLSQGSPEQISDALTEDDLYKREHAGALVGLDGSKNHLFNRGKRWQRPILAYPSGHTRVSSSLAPMAKRIEEFRRIGIGGAIGSAVALAALLVAGLNLSANFYKIWTDTKVDKEQVVEMLRRVDSKQGELDRRLREAENLLDRLRPPKR